MSIGVVYPDDFPVTTTPVMRNAVGARLATAEKAKIVPAKDVEAAKKLVSGRQWAEGSDPCGLGPSLIAVSATANRSKGDREPQDWLPVARPCVYIGWWLAVKTRWDLAVDRAERRFLRSSIASCGDRSVAAPPRAAIDRRSGASGGPPPAGGTDPRFDWCYQAIAAGYGPFVRNVSVTGNVLTACTMGIGVTVVNDPKVGRVTVTGNTISGATGGGVVGLEWENVVSDDLARDAGKYAHILVTDNAVA